MYTVKIICPIFANYYVWLSLTFWVIEHLVATVRFAL